MSQDIIIRLRALRSAATDLSARAPAADISQIGVLSHSVAQAGDKLIRVLEASPSGVSTVRLTRFATTAESVMVKMQQLCTLYGREVSADQVSQPMEAQLRDVVGNLSGFAQIAMTEVMSKITDELAIDSDQIAAWSVPVIEKVTTAPVPSRAQSQEGELVMAFMKGLAPVSSSVPAPIAVAAARGFFGRLLNRSAPSAPDEATGSEIGMMPRDVEVSAADVDSLMKTMSDPTRSVLNTFYIPGIDGWKGSPEIVRRWSHPLLKIYGMRAATQGMKTVGLISHAPPEQMTVAWERIAHSICGDPENLRRALHIRKDSSFRTAIARAVCGALAQMERQIMHGSPMPLAKVSDPVVHAALVCTLNSAEKPPLFKDRPLTRGRDYDPFDIRAPIEDFVKSCPGLCVYAHPQGLVLATQNGYVRPEGVVAELHKNVSNTKKLFNAAAREGEPFTLRTRTDIIPTLDTSLNAVFEAFLTIYGRKKAPPQGTFAEGEITMSTDAETGDVIYTHLPPRPEVRVDADGVHWM